MKSRKKISFIFGTRPEAIKLAPVILLMKSHPSFECEVCVTAQHREMLDQVLEVFDIVPDIDLDVMKKDQSLASLTSLLIESLDAYLKESKPDMVIVQGDTTSVFSGALAAFYNKIPVGHIEAGLRTFNLGSPWPEEGNRVLTSHISSMHFAPTEISKANLLKEGIGEDNIYVTGNTVISALFSARKILKDVFTEIPGISEKELVEAQKIILITGHRRENFGEGFESICQAIAILAERFPEYLFVYPVHLNPSVREPVNRILNSTKLKNIRLIEPLSYLPFIRLMDLSTIILTDSGGVQEEAPSLGKPVLVMRDTTERPEAVAAGTVKLVGTNIDAIVKETSSLLSDPIEYERMSIAINPYGDENSAQRIMDSLIES